MFENIRRWLKGSFTCSKCGKAFHIMSVGFGTTICPICSENNNGISLCYDESYWLNRFILSISRAHKPEIQLSV